MKEYETRGIDYEPGTPQPEEKKNKRYHDTVRVLEAYWDDEEEEIKAYYDEVREEFEKPGGILDQIEDMSADERRAALDNIQQGQEYDD